VIPQTAPPSALRRKAERASTVFDVLALLTLIGGGLTAVALLLSGGFVAALVAVLVTVVAWAQITVFTVVTGYIAERAGR
jgi:hypothetical protein